MAAFKPSKTEIEGLLRKAAHYRRMAQTIDDLRASEALRSLAEESVLKAAKAVAEARSRHKP